jgi:hypothetical protein
MLIRYIPVHTHTKIVTIDPTKDTFKIVHIQIGQLLSFPVYSEAQMC